MPLHEQKNCPRCNKLFECKVGDIGRCQCSGILLSTEMKLFIEIKYNDCICINCLQALKNKYIFLKRNIFLSKCWR